MDKIHLKVVSLTLKIVGPSKGLGSGFTFYVAIYLGSKYSYSWTHKNWGHTVSKISKLPILTEILLPYGIIQCITTSRHKKVSNIRKHGSDKFLSFSDAFNLTCSLPLEKEQLKHFEHALRSLHKEKQRRIILHIGIRLAMNLLHT